MNFILSDLTISNTQHADWGVLTGEYVLEYLLPHLYARKNIVFQRGLTGKIIQRHVVVKSSKMLTARCDFIKINRAVVALIMPQNRWVDHQLLESTLAAASGISIDSDPWKSRIRTALTMDPILSPNSPELDPKIPLSERAETNLSETFQEVDYLVKIDDEWTLRNLKERYLEHKRSVFFSYGRLSEGKIECRFHQQIARINGKLTTFLYPVGQFEDRKIASKLLCEAIQKPEAIFTEGRLPLLF